MLKSCLKNRLSNVESKIDAGCQTAPIDVDKKANTFKQPKAAPPQTHKTALLLDILGSVVETIPPEVQTQVDEGFYELASINPSGALMSCRGQWLGRQVRILVDSGCSKEAILNTKFKLPPQAHAYANTGGNITLLTGSGVVSTTTTTFAEQKITVQGNSINVNELTRVSIGELPYDIILGLPFLKKYNPKVCWRTGELRFKKQKFSWVCYGTDPDNEIQAINASVLMQELKTGEATLIIANVSEILKEPDKASLDARIDKCISDEISEDKRNEMRNLIKVFSSRDSIGSEKDNLPHREDMSGFKPPRWDFKIPLKSETTNEGPHAKPRPMTPVEMNELKRQLMFLLKHGFIKPSKSRFASPTLFAKKKDGSLRWCCDFRTLNKISYHEASPLPNIRSLIDKISTAKYFTALDLIQGYHQLSVHPQDTWKTAITTPYGLFEWMVVPFGVSGAPGHFQSVMSELFGPLTKHSQYVLNLLDDLLIFSNTWDEHMTHVKKVLRVLDRYKFYINFSKCSFAQREIVYVGQKIGRGQRKPDPSKVQALLESPIPSTATELRSFLGLANYLSSFIPRYAEMIAPFSYHRGLKKRVGIELTKEHRKSIEQLKEMLSKEPVLKLPDFTKKFYVQIDASKVGCGSVLMQKYENKLLPVAYRARILTKPQKKWPIHDLELFALVDATKHFRQYLQDKPFVMLSDHKPLEHFKQQKQLNMRQLRYIDHLAMFQYTIEYIPGDKNIFADYLSRPAGHHVQASDVQPDFKQAACSLCKLAEEDAVLDEFDLGNIPKLPKRVVHTHTCTKAELTAIVASMTTTEGIQELPLQDIKDAYVYDAKMQQIVDTVLDKKSKHHYKQKYFVTEDLLYLRPVEGEISARLLIPKANDLRARVIELHHDHKFSGHFDADTTYLHTRERCYWPSMRQDIRRYVSTCHKCIEHKSVQNRPAGLYQPLEYPLAQPMAELASDFAIFLPPSKHPLMGTTMDAIQIWVCRLSRRVRLIPGKTTDDAFAIAQKFYWHMFPMHGLPRSIVSDRDTKFTSDFWRHLSKCLGVKLKMSSAHRPQTDGLAESTVKIVKMLVRIFVNYAQDDWCEMLPMFEFCINRKRVRNRGNGLTGYTNTPFLLSEGYNPLSITDIAMPPLTDGKVQDYVERRKLALALAQDAIIAGQDKIAEHYNKKRRVVSYEVGDQVMIDKNHITPPEVKETKSFSLRPKWCGPYPVIQLVGNNAIKVKLPPGMLKHPVVSVESTKPYPADGRMKHTKPVDVDGEQHYVVDAILDTKMHSNRRKWLVQWKGVDTTLVEQGSRTWEPYSSFKSESGVTIHLIEFEEKRTGLLDTHLDDWEYDNLGEPGTHTLYNDGHKVYVTKNNESLVNIASKHKVDTKDLRNMNARKFGEKNLQGNCRFKIGTALRLPKPIVVTTSVLQEKSRRHGKRFKAHY